MSVHPQQGGSSGTWGTELRAFFGTVFDLATGKIKTLFTDVENVEQYADFATAITTIGNNVKTLVIPSLQTVAGNVTVPSTLTLQFIGTGELSVNATFTVTINGPLEAPLRQVFSGSGSVRTSSTAKVFASWWGLSASATGSVNRAAIQSAIDSTLVSAESTTVKIPPGTFTTDVPINMRSNVTLAGSGYSSVLKIPDNFNTQDNYVKLESISNAIVTNFRVDGNRANQTQTNYGIYLGAATDCVVRGCWVGGCTGDGIHVYNSDRALVTNNRTTDNFFHGMEIEQTRDSIVSENHSYANLLHGIFVFEGEVGATGCKRVEIYGNTLNNNTQYGIAVQGPLTEHISVLNNIIYSNTQYGCTFFDTGDHNSFSGNTVFENGFFGMYIYRNSNSIVANNLFKDNSQAANGAYAEILIQGNAGKRSTDNLITNNVFRITATNKASHSIKEASTADGPNYIMNNIVADGSSGVSLAVLHADSIVRNNVGFVSENWAKNTFNGDGVATAFVIAHGLAATPVSAIVTAGSADADGDLYITYDNTNITATFGTAPISGTNNVVLNWIARIDNN